MPKFNRVLVVETAFPGDAVIATAVAEEIKRLQPETTITYLVRPEVADLIRCAPAIDEVKSFDKYGSDTGVEGIKRMAGELTEGAYDVAFVLNPSTRNSALIERSHIPNIRFLDDQHLAGRPRSEVFISILSQDYQGFSGKTLPRLAPPMINGKFNLPSEYIVVAPGSVWATKCWGAERFQSVVATFEEQSIPSVIIGAINDHQRGAIVASGNALCVDLTGQTSFVEAASIIACAQVVIANDSAPVHIATAVRTPVVAIFGPTVSEFGFAPPSEWGAVVESEVWCRPCTSHGPEVCPIHTHDCMKRISVDQVLEATFLITRVQ